MLFMVLSYMFVMPVHAENTFYRGIDVSGYQGKINFEEVKNFGIDIVYMKASEGTGYVDSHFNENYEGAKQNGLKVGFYHYLDARTIEDAIEEARFFVSVISDKTPDCRLAIDFESFGSLSKEEINAISLSFMKEVERLTNKEMVVYSDAYNAKEIFSGEILNYPLWVAQYDVSYPSYDLNWNSWIGWQYADNGEVLGINTYVDMDKFTKDIFLNEISNIPLPDGINKPKAGGTKEIIIQYGDTLSYLANKYNTTVQRLVELNNIQNPNLIYAGNTLLVPSGETIEDTDKNSTSGQNIYIVKAGDTLDLIASMYGTTAISIAIENNISNINLIYPGQRLIIPTTRYDLNHTLYKIKWGDTLWSISRRYNVPIAKIVMLNRIKNPNLIYVGSIIRL